MRRLALLSSVGAALGPLPPWHLRLAALLPAATAASAVALPLRRLALGIAALLVSRVCI